jgi:ABC-type amino acid transport system permease subunit
MPAVKTLCVLYVELIRGVPLISVLFMASVMFPLFMPAGVNIDKLLRAQEPEGEPVPKPRPGLFASMFADVTVESLSGVLAGQAAKLKARSS